MKPSNKIKRSFPLSLYFKQLFCSNCYVRLINPWKFWHQYQLEYLEACWNFNIIQHLERCKQKKLPPSKLNYSHKYFENQTATYRESNFTGITASQSIILITQPSIKLKYRGVTYFANHIVAVDVNKINFIPNSFNDNTLDKCSITYRDNSV